MKSMKIAVSPGSRLRLAAAVLGLCAITLLAFAKVGSLDFIEIYDDGEYLTSNPVVREGLTAAGVRWAFTSLGYSANWHPLTWLSHMLDVQLFGLRPRGHHLVNLTLHLLNAELLLLVLRALTGSLWRSAFVAALFAVHPLHVQSVAWVAERKDVLSTFFGLVTLGAYLRYLRRPGTRRYALVVVAFGLGLLAKPMLVTLPFVLLLLDFWPLGRVGGGRGGLNTRALSAVALEKVPLFLLAAASSVLTVLAQERALTPTKILPLGARLANALLAYVGYLGKMVWPAHLAIFYPGGNEIVAMPVVAAGSLLALLTAAAFLYRRRHPALAVGWFWYLGTLVPVIGLIQVGGQALADRYTYIPLIGIFIALTWGLSDLASGWRPRRWILPGGAALIVGALLPRTMIEVGYWKDSLTLFGRALEVTSKNWVAESDYGILLMKQGRVEEALPHLMASAHLSPEAAEAAYNLGVGLFKLGRSDEAEAAFRQALQLDPANVPAHYNLGVCAAEGGDLEAAIAQFREALRYQPDHLEAHFNLGLALEKRGARQEALEHYREALRISPGDRDAQGGVQRILGIK